MPYDPSLSTQRDHLRLLLSDIAATPILPDATYDAKIATNGYLQAALDLANYFLIYYGQKATSATVLNEQISWNNRLEAIKSLISNLKAGLIAEPGADVRTGIACGDIVIPAYDLR